MATQILASSAALVGAESILALTPVAIKKTPLDATSALWSRILTSAVLGYFLTSDRSVSQPELFSATALGYTNLLHIASSYEAFRNLPAGQAMSLLYTYPLWNLIFGYIFEKETITKQDFGYMSLAAVGSTLLNQDPGAVVSDAAKLRNPDSRWGVLMGLISAMTESGMHTLLKRLDWLDPAKSVWVVNGSAGLWLGGLMGLNTMFGHSAGKMEIHGTWMDSLLLTLFHGFVIFSGYWLRFYAVPRLSTVTYSILSYSGLFASYLYGLFILGEKPSWMSMAGALLILLSGVFLQVRNHTPTQEKED